MDNQRFTVVDTERHGMAPTTTIIVDKITGVNYLYVKSGYSGGLTPLLDKDGKPIITPNCK